MFYSYNKGASPVTGFALFALLLLIAGCNHGAEPPASGGAAQTAGGDKLFQTNCSRCHAVGGQGGQRAPDLSHEGSDPQHTQQWIAEHIKNPQSHTPGSRMPAFAGRLADADIQTIATYLASQK